MGQTLRLVIGFCVIEIGGGGYVLEGDLCNQLFAAVYGFQQLEGFLFSATRYSKLSLQNTL